MKKNVQPRNFKRLMLGDILEISLMNGYLAYAQYVFNHREPPVWGHLIRVLDGTFKVRPLSFHDMVQKEERFFAFFPAGAALSQGMIEVVANEQIPDRCKKFPLFKAYNKNYETGEKTWFLWDGNREWKLEKLLPEQYNLPLHEIVSFDVLVERIESGWAPRDEI